MQANIRGALVSVAAPVFLADMDHARARLRLHVRRGVDAADVRARAQAALDGAGQPVEVAILTHDLGQLAYPRSLEHWLDRFQLGEVIHDPTMIVARARALLSAARACREAMGAQARGIFFDPGRRTLIVLIKGGKNGPAPSTRAWVRSVVDEAWESDPDAAEASSSSVVVQVVASLPKGDLVPVDAGSASVKRRLNSAIRRWLAPIALVLAASAVAGPAAAKLDSRQPISATNARVSSDFGVLSGLSVFADGQRRHDPDMFVSSGLNTFFGNAVSRGQAVRVAQTLRRADIELATVPDNLGS